MLLMVYLARTGKATEHTTSLQVAAVLWIAALLAREAPAPIFFVPVDVQAKAAIFLDRALVARADKGKATSLLVVLLDA